MTESLNKPLFGKDVGDSGDARALREQIAQVCHQIQMAESMFNLAESEELLDASIYQIKALRSYLDFLLRAAKSGQYPVGVPTGAQVGGG